MLYVTESAAALCSAPSLSMVLNRRLEQVVVALYSLYKDCCAERAATSIHHSSSSQFSISALSTTHCFITMNKQQKHISRKFRSGEHPKHPLFRADTTFLFKNIGLFTLLIHIPNFSECFYLGVWNWMDCSTDHVNCRITTCPDH